MRCPNCDAQNLSDSNFCSKCSTPLVYLDETLAIDPAILEPLEKQLKLGSIFAGRYKLVTKLGRGGMGVVYKAIDIKLHRSVALKFLKPGLITHPDYKLRFIQEAQTASVLDHQNICTIYEIDETEDGNMYIAMAFYEGVTLKKMVEQGPLLFDQVLDIVIQIAQGLSAAHGQGIVHRDIKPANVILTRDGVAKIVDFGLAKLAGQSRLTETMTLMGTAFFMSPEQARGDETDQKSDIWSLGVVFYELLAGELPFQGENIQGVIYSVLNKSPVPPTETGKDIPEEAERIIMKCLRKNQEDRYRSAELLLSDLVKLRRSLERKETEEEAEREKEPKARKETERRQATVMCAEISGYSEMMESLDAEEVVVLTSRCFGMFESVIRENGGRINKITGSNFTAIFGIPVAIEDGPKKAINAAIGLRKSLYEFNRKEGFTSPLDIQIGIDTGTVIAGAISAGEYSVMGEAINIASGLKELSEDGKISIGLQTYRYTQNEFEYKPFKPITVKGIKQPVSWFELLSVKEKVYRAQLGAERMIYSEMVGRDRELDKLKLHVLKVINGEGSIVNVIGEAGIGKSRLIAELVQKDEMKKVNFLRGRALSLGRNLSFHPITDILKNWARIKEEDTKVTLAQKLEKAIKNIYPEGTSEIFPFIATLMGVKLTGKHAERVEGIEGKALERLILKNLRELVEKAAEIKPLVIVIEDLHWADLTSIAFFESLYRLAENNRILFINVYRPNYSETSDRIRRKIHERHKDYYSEICLEPLDETQCETLIKNLLNVEGLPVQTQDLIATRAEGNPFFIEEVARSLIDEGIVELRDGGFRVKKTIDSVVIPKTINEILMARIDRLEEDTRSLLKVASVIGRNFFYKILDEVAATVEEKDDKLEYLKEIQLIKERKRLEEIEYLFKHALVQEAVYNSILIKKRKELHLSVARSIEAVFHERLHEFYGMLAYHFSLAEDSDKAEEYLINAGKEAMKSSASSEALHYNQEALKIYISKHGETADPGKIAMLEKNIALAFFQKGQYNEAVEYFDKTLTYYGETFPKHPAAILLKFLTGLFRFLKYLYFPSLTKIREASAKDKEIISLNERKSRALSTANPKRMFIETFYWVMRLARSDLTKVDSGVGLFAMLSGLFSFSGMSFNVSRKILERAKEKLDKNDFKCLLYYEYSELIVDLLAGDWDRAEYDENLVTQNLKIGDIWLVTAYVLFHGYIRIEQGERSKARESREKLLEIQNLFEDDFSRTTYFLYSVKYLSKYRNFNELLDKADDAAKFFNSIGYKTYAAVIYSYKAQAELMVGNFEESEKNLQTAKKLNSESNPAPMTVIEYYIGRLILNIQRMEDAKNSGDTKAFSEIRKASVNAVRKAIKLSKHVAPELTQVFRLVGTYYWIAGNQNRAQKCWEKSIKFGETLNSKLELSRTYMEVGKRMLEKHSKHKELNGIGAQEYLEKAETLFKEMSLTWDLGELTEEGDWLKKMT